jgi:hypothetical protein
MSTETRGRPAGSTRSPLERARQSLTLRRNWYEDLEYKQEKERKNVLRSVVEAETLVTRLEAEEATAAATKEQS